LHNTASAPHPAPGCPPGASSRASKRSATSWPWCPTTP